MEKAFSLKEPPLGLVPRFIHQAGRLRKLEEAICRYLAENHPLPIHWIHEYNQLCEYFENRKPGDLT